MCLFQCCSGGLLDKIYATTQRTTNLPRFSKLFFLLYYSTRYRMQYDSATITRVPFSVFTSII